jgi:hypothetical protein
MPTTTLVLTKGAHAIIDDCDAPAIARYKWHLSSAGYAARTTGSGPTKETRLMHREILQPAQGVYVDHINCNKCDNRRSNLRLCSGSQNMGNIRPGRPGKFKGVHEITWVSVSAKKHFHACIGIEGRTVSLGCFATAHEAALAYDVAALAYFGAFARLNFPQATALSRDDHERVA